MINPTAFASYSGRRRSSASVVLLPPTEPIARSEVSAQGSRLILASGSPRRRELLGALGASFAVVVTDAEEHETPTPPEVRAALPVPAEPLTPHPTLLAWRKARAVADEAGDSVVIGADTVVVVDGIVMSKPADEAEATAMLQRIAGRSHMVFTGLCVIRTSEQPQLWLDLVATEVRFDSLDARQIADYVATGEPLDKAGAYGVQGLGGRLVREVRGSYTAVVGFPLVAAHRLLSAAGITGLADPTATYKRWLQSQGKEPLPWPPTLP